MRISLLIIFFVANLSISFAQNVGIGTTNPDASAKLEVKSNNSGFLPPRMTYVERNAIVSPAAGLIVYCTDCGFNGEWQGFKGDRWVNIHGSAANTPLPPADTTINSVTIGSQTWSTKNLDVARYRNGDAIPQVTDPAQWSNLTTGAWCWYNNDSATYAATYGRLYNWYAVNDPRGLAPQGWRIPTEGDWNRLAKFIDPGADTTCRYCIQSSSAGGAMKSTTGWNAPNTGATNSSGFAGLPGGYRYDDGAFDYVGIFGVWWSAGEFDASFAWLRYLDYDGANVYRTNFNKAGGFSVRVVRDTSYDFSNQSLVSWNEIKGKPTTVDGYGISDAVTINDNQTIAGEKIFTNVTRFNNKQLKEVANPVYGNDAATKFYVDSIQRKIFAVGTNIQDTLTINDNVDVFTTSDGSWNRYYKLPIPTSSNANLNSRIGDNLMIRCRSSFNFHILPDNTDMTQNLTLNNGMTAVFIYDGSKWLKVLPN
jgi:uncharacterized protein (TIGR02145 family)